MDDIEAMDLLDDAAHKITKETSNADIRKLVAELQAKGVSVDFDSLLQWWQDTTQPQGECSSCGSSDVEMDEYGVIECNNCGGHRVGDTAWADGETDEMFESRPRKREATNQIDQDFAPMEPGQQSLFDERVYSDVGYVDMCREMMVDDGEIEMAVWLLQMVAKHALNDHGATGTSIQEAVLAQAEELYGDMDDEDEIFIKRSSPESFDLAMRLFFKAFAGEFFPT